MLLSGIHGGIIRRVPGDGHCFYHCLAVHFEKIGLLHLIGANKYQTPTDKALAGRRQLADFYMVMPEHAFDNHHLRIKIDQHDIPGELLAPNCKLTQC
jgi:hypothetical protein